MQIVDKYFRSDLHFLLNSFTAKDIEDIIDDLKRSFDGFHFLYIIDTYDILENYLPYTQGELFSKREINFQAQKFICYDYFFGELNQTNTILLDEYKIELLAAKNKLNKQLMDASAVINNLNELKKETQDFLNNPEKTEAFFNENLEVILFLLILNDKTNNILNEFFTFITNRVHISEVKSDNDKNVQVLNQIFKACKHSKFSTVLFSAFIDENKTRLLVTDDLDKRHIYLENTYRDVQAIERIMHINEMFANMGLKFFAIYLSSANKTPEIFKVLLKLKKDNTNNYQLKFYRNIYQYFLYDRIRSEYKTKHSEGIEVLTSLRDLLLKMTNDSGSEKAITHNDNDNFEVLKIVKKLFDEKSNNIDNHFYLSVYEKYKSTFDSLNDQNTKEGLERKQIIAILKQIEKKKKVVDVKSFDLRFSLPDLNQTYDMVETYTGFDDFEPDYRYGNDIVRNPYQHLPILPMVEYEIPPKIKRELYVFLNHNVEFSTEKNKLKNLFKVFVSESSRMPASDLKSKFIKSILITYINLVAQSKTSNNNYSKDNNTLEQLEANIISDLERQFEIIKFQYLKFNPSKTALSRKVEFSIDNPSLLVEITYLLVWLYRRNNREDDGIEKAKEMLLEKGDDPRLYQGIGLCYISKLYKLIKLKRKEVQLEIENNTDLAFQYMKIAKEKYQLLLNHLDSIEVQQVAIKNYIAVLNSLADLALRKYEFSTHFDISFIEMARSFINEIKSLFDTIKLIYDQYPTYSATEFEIEYYEALYFYQNNEMSKAHQKIINATTRESTIQKIPDFSKYIDEVFLIKRKELYNLARNIYKQLKK